METFKYFFIISLLTLSLSSMSQNLFVQSYIERTSVSPKLGTQIGYEFKGGYELGGFYQEEAELMMFSEREKPYRYEKEFYGIFMAATVMQRNKLSLKLNARIGVANKINFAITPSVLANYQLFNRISLQAGVGARTFMPTVQGGLKIKLG